MAWFDDRIVCPECGAPLALSDPRCECGFAAPSSMPPDLRPRAPVARSLPMPVQTSASEALAQCDLERPRVTYGGPKPIRDSSELFSAVEPHLHRGLRLLDLGCGPRDQAPPAEHYGLLYAGVDYSSPAADLLADAHALPFAGATFDLVLSYAVFEHLHNPYLAASEVARVLVPGGIFFGAVSQGEPFHESYFHHTALGVLALLDASGFRVRRLWPSYDTLHALAVMGRYPRVTRGAIELLHRFARATPFLAPRTFFRAPRREKQLDELHRAASLCFVAERVA